MLQKYTIVRDNREKKPLQFPRTIVTLNHDKLPTRYPTFTVELEVIDECLNSKHPELCKADYYIQGFPDACVVERKGNLREITTNCLNRTRRRAFISELVYLRNRCRFPILLLEGKAAQYMKSTKHNPNPGLGFTALIKLLQEYRIGLLMMGSDGLRERQAMGECVAHMLISGTKTYVLDNEKWNSSLA